jgi:hypothetical protein
MSPFLLDYIIKVSILRNAPILFLAFRRPDKTLQVLESLSANKESSSSELHCFIDGPRNKDDKIKISEVKAVIRSKRWAGKLYIHESDANRGCAQQLISSVTALVQEKGKVIIIEDDNLLSPYFLGYMNRGLDHYKDHPRVMEVTGYMFPIKKNNLPSGFLRGNCGWGWGTWDDSWKNFEPDGQKLISQFTEKKQKYEFNFHNSFNYFDMLKNQVEGKIGGWDIRWYASIFLNNGYTLYPGVALVKNIGFDGSGTNTGETKNFERELSSNPKIIFPDKIIESEELLEETIQFFKFLSGEKKYLKKIGSKILNYNLLSRLSKSIK